MMEIPVRIVDDDSHVKAWLKIWSGVLSLTNMDIEILSYIMINYIKVKRDGVMEPYASKLVLGNDSIKDIRKKFNNMSRQAFNNYKAKFKEKKVLIEEEDVLFINPKLVPQKELVFKFES